MQYNSSSAGSIPGRAVADYIEPQQMPNRFAGMLGEITNTLYSSALIKQQNELAKQHQLEERQYQEEKEQNKWERGAEEREADLEYKKALTEKTKGVISGQTEFSLTDKARMKQAENILKDEMASEADKKAARANIEMIITKYENMAPERQAEIKKLQEEIAKKEAEEEKERNRPRNPDSLALEMFNVYATDAEKRNMKTWRKLVKAGKQPERYQKMIDAAIKKYK